MVQKILSQLSGSWMNVGKCKISRLYPMYKFLSQQRVHNNKKVSILLSSDSNWSLIMIIRFQFVNQVCLNTVKSLLRYLHKFMACFLEVGKSLTSFSIDFGRSSITIMIPLKPCLFFAKFIFQRITKIYTQNLEEVRFP